VSIVLIYFFFFFNISYFYLSKLLLKIFFLYRNNNLKIYYEYCKKNKIIMWIKIRKNKIYVFNFIGYLIIYYNFWSNNCVWTFSIFSYSTLSYIFIYGFIFFFCCIVFYKEDIGFIFLLENKSQVIKKLQRTIFFSILYFIIFLKLLNIYINFSICLNNLKILDNFICYIKFFNIFFGQWALVFLLIFIIIFIWFFSFYACIVFLPLVHIFSILWVFFFLSDIIYKKYNYIWFDNNFLFSGENKLISEKMFRKYYFNKSNWDDEMLIFKHMFKCFIKKWYKKLYILIIQNIKLYIQKKLNKYIIYYLIISFFCIYFFWSFILFCIIY